MMRAGLIASVFTALLLFTPAVHAQDLLKPACDSANSADSALCDDTQQQVNSNSLFGPDGIATRLISLFSIVIGIAATIMIIIGGLKYILSSGDSNNINSAKNTILYAIIGLAVAATAQLLVRFVLYRIK